MNSWKVNESGNLVLEDGKPVFILEDGQEVQVDYLAMRKKNHELTRENVDRKNENRRLKNRYESLEEIDDFSAWLDETHKAREMMANYSDGQKASEEQIKARIELGVKPWREKSDSLQKKLDETMRDLQAKTLRISFMSSKYAKENLEDPALVAKLFKDNFAMREGRLVTLDENGNEGMEIYDETTFDEALKLYVENSPFKASLLKGARATGSGGNSAPFGKAQNIKNPWLEGSKNSTLQSQIYRENPALARQMMKEAGYDPRGL